MIQYDIVVPPELRNVAVLDASWAIRDLEQLDKTIKDDPSFDSNIKTYGNVTLHQLPIGSGRKSMTTALLQRREDRKVSQEIVKVVKGIPEDQGILLFTFKQRRAKEIDMAETLRGDLRAAGVDVDAILPNGEPRLVWLTWGLETSVSEFQYCENVIFAGMFHRSDVDLAGAIVGQKDNLTAPVSNEDIVKVRRSEIVHSFYQGISRAACRRSINGAAVACRAWVIHYDTKNFRRLVDRIMPGVRWAPWEAVVMAEEAKEYAVALRIENYLRDLPPQVARVGSKTLKADMGEAAVAGSTWTKALNSCLDWHTGWRRPKRGAQSIERIPAEAFGFVTEG